jgi:murein DD-endopeptidase MepM/ murein hydrolase activator NlpD
MRSPRYTVLLANRKTGAVRRFTFVRLPAIVSVLAILALPTLIGLGARWAGKADLDNLREANESLRLENENYRAMTGELATQVSSLQDAIDDLSRETALEPVTRQAFDRLPASIRSRAMGGGFAATPLASNKQSPESTFGALKDLLGALEDRLTTVRKGVEGRQALVAALPRLWPLTTGWLTSNFGDRTDPITGEAERHTGLDISAKRGTAVFATADGTVQLASFNGSYGNCVELSHGYGITTRYGHLSKFAVEVGQQIKRGDVIGYVGATGRTTGSHLHYEILLNSKPINPLQFLGKPQPVVE